MIPCKDALGVKLMKNARSFLFHRIPESDGILGPPPQLNRVEFSKNGELMQQLYITWKSPSLFGILSLNFTKEIRKGADVHDRRVFKVFFYFQN